MNKIISTHETIYKKRRITHVIRQIAEVLPVIVVTGARQVGKSTMLKAEFADYDYLTLDDYSLLEQARKDPQSLWINKPFVIIDEAQKCPQLFDAIKLAVDRSERKQHFIISGSANMYLMEKVTESLAGRAAYVDILPLTLGESLGVEHPVNFQQLWLPEVNLVEVPKPFDDIIETLFRGFMPSVMTLQTSTQVLLWLDGYVKTYLERDLRELSQVDSLIDFRRLMQSLAIRTGAILNQADVAKDSGLSHPTAHRYIKLLEVSNIISRVPAYFSSRSKRIVKSPKLFFLDPSICAFLAGYTDFDSLANCRELGGFFETLVYLHIRSHCELMTPAAKIYYWRTSTKREVDFVIEHGRNILPIEVKMTRKPTIADAQHLIAFLDEHPQAVRGILVHGGDQHFWLHSKVLAVPWWSLEF